MKLPALLALAVWSALIGGGAEAGPVEQLEEARAKWREHGSDRYQFVISDGCFCLHPAYVGPLRITVIKGSAVRPVYVGRRWGSYYSGRQVKIATHLRTTMPELFDQIARSLAAAPHEYFRLGFDPTDGHVTRFGYDHPQMEDEQTEISIERFRHLRKR